MKATPIIIQTKGSAAPSFQIMQIRDRFAQDADLVAVALAKYHGLVLGVG